MTNSPFDDIKALIAGLPEAGAGGVKADPALGRLGQIRAWLSAWRMGPELRVNRPIIALYAGCAAGGDPEAVRGRLELIAAGGAAVNALTQGVGAGLEAFDLAIDRPVGDMALRAAMSERECAATMAFGMEALAKQPDLLVVGSVGDNDASAAAIALALYGGQASDWTLAAAPYVAQAVQRAVEEAPSAEPLELLRQLGGRETAAMAGAILAARNQGVPVLLDGYGAAAAAAVLARIDAGSILHVMAGDVSGEAGHARLLSKLNLQPIVKLGMDVGEGAGAAAVLSLVRAACELNGL